MKRKYSLTAIMVIMMVLTRPRIAAAEPLLAQFDGDIVLSGSLDVYTDYMWRGFVLDRDPVVQPGISCSFKGFTFSLWSSWDAGNDVGAQSDEIDYVLDYTYGVSDLVSISAGYTYYDFPATQGYSREFYLGIGFSEIPSFSVPIAVQLTFYRDHGDEINGGGLGNYVSLDFSHSYSLDESIGMSLESGLHFGYNRKLFITGKNGYDIGVSLGVSIPLTHTVTITPSLNYSVPFEDLDDANDGNQDDRFYGGLSLAYEF